MPLLEGDNWRQHKEDLLGDGNTASSSPLSTSLSPLQRPHHQTLDCRLPFSRAKTMEDYSDSQSSPTTSLARSSPPTTPGAGSDNGDVPYLDLHGGQFGVQLGEPSSTRYILVIGGLGFIGSHTTLELLRAGYNVLVVDDLSNSYEHVLLRVKKLAAKHYHGSGRTVPALRFHKLDYRSDAMRFLLETYSDLAEAPGSSGEGSRLVRRSKVAGVIHFAAFKAVSESIEKPLQYYENNVCGLVSLLGLLASHNIRNFVFSSSATVYGDKANSGLSLREEDLVHHPETYVKEDGQEVKAEPMISGLTSPYGRSKYFCEAILADVAVADPAWRIIALRYFNPIGCDPSGLLGEDPRMVPTNLFPVITQVLTGDRPILDVFGTDWDTRDGTAVRDFVHVSDVARGHVAAVDAKSDAPFRTYNLGSGTGTTVIEAIQSLEQASEKKIPVRWVGRRAGDVGTCVASRDRAVRELGWYPRETIAKCASDLWNYVTKTKKDAADAADAAKAAEAAKNAAINATTDTAKTTDVPKVTVPAKVRVPSKVTIPIKPTVAAK